MERSSLQSDILAKERDIQSLKQELSYISSSRDKEKDSATKELNEVYSNLKKEREEKERAQEELGVVLEQVSALSKAMEKMKGELEARVLELEECRERLESSNEDCSKLNSQVVSVRNQKQSLEFQLNEAKEKAVRLEEEVNEYTKELARERMNHEDMKTKAIEFSNTLDTLQQLLENVNKILKDTSAQYSQELAPLLAGDKELFGIEFSGFSFPLVSTLDSAEYLPNLLRWASAFRVFVDLMANTVKDVRNSYYMMSGNLEREKALSKKLNYELNEKAEENYHLKESLQMLNDNSNEANAKLREVKDELEKVVEE